MTKSKKDTIDFDDIFATAKKESEYLNSHGYGQNKGLKFKHLRDEKNDFRNRLLSRASRIKYKKRKPTFRDIAFFEKMFNGDARRHVAVAKTCSSCAYGFFPKPHINGGFCLLATKQKSLLDQLPAVVPVNKKTWNKNNLYTDMYWVRTTRNIYCDSHEINPAALSSISRFLNNTKGAKLKNNE